MMATPDEVRASLLASGDHGRDGCARRKLADQVREVVAETLKAKAVHAHAEVATAASAVVLASGLRAPAETRAEFAKRLTEAVKDGQVTLSRPARDFADGAAQAVREDNREMHLPPNRQGWRARLANVERLLAASLDSKTPRQAAETVADALAEIRAMIDGEGE